MQDQDTDEQDEDERLAAPFYRGAMLMWLADHPNYNADYWKAVVWPEARKRIASFERERQRQQQRDR